MYDHLARDGDRVLAPTNPLRGIPYDASYTESLIDQRDAQLEITDLVCRFIAERF